LGKGAVAQQAMQAVRRRPSDLFAHDAGEAGFESFIAARYRRAIKLDEDLASWV